MCEIIVSMYSCEKFTCKSTLERRFRSLAASGALPNREVCSDAMVYNGGNDMGHGGRGI